MHQQLSSSHVIRRMMHGNCRRTTSMYCWGPSTSFKTVVLVSHTSFKTVVLVSHFKTVVLVSHSTSTCFQLRAL